MRAMQAAYEGGSTANELVVLVVGATADVSPVSTAAPPALRIATAATALTVTTK
jgi:hypothetical protein